MVKVFIKGGVWKNSEDEILKAAVQKYGKQQWARVASLLNRKSAKQCKARWHEWLDPSVRKIEWSRQEEEKLLHLAKLMPAQWKTIAPIVGRTASQCQEHYEQLLDQAAQATASAGSGSESESDGSGVAGAGSTLRKQYQPGQIDSHPETKPARPDPMDMDEDEIEMLQEARARLANTQGKKAKRKAREKMLAQAKRLADLQKRRELKQAGLLSSNARKKAKRRSRDIDLGVEIPFHKPAPAGFHDTTSEDVRAHALREKQMTKVNYQQLNEQQYRSRDREAAMAKKREEARLRALEKSNMQYVINQVSDKNDPSTILTNQRKPLDLPAPQVSDEQLLELAKLQEKQQDASPATAGGDGGATQALLGDYSNRPLPTPMRTPMSKPSSSTTTTQESILREASQLRRIEQTQTPLLAAASATHDDEEEEDNMGIKEDDATVHTAATPGGPMSSKDDNRKPSATTTTRTPLRTPTRDELGLNQRPLSELRSSSASVGGVSEYNDDYSVGASTFATATTAGAQSIKEMARRQRKEAKRARLQLEQALASLPAPQFEYELGIPTTVTDDDDDDEDSKPAAIEKDAAEVEEEKRKELAAQAKKLYEQRSSVLKRPDLPRPTSLISIQQYHQPTVSTTESVSPEELVEQEMMTLLKHDAYAFPILPAETDDDAKDDAASSSSKKKKKKKKGKKRKKADEDDEEEPTKQAPQQPIAQPVDLEHIPEEALNHAKDLVEQELETLLEDKKKQAAAVLSEKNKDKEYNDDDIQDYLVQINHQASTDNNEFDEDQKRKLLQLLQDQTKALQKKNSKLVQKNFTVLYGGYQKRCHQLSIDTTQTYHDLCNTTIEHAVYKRLRDYESNVGAKHRLEQVQEELQDVQQTNEQVLQKKYSNLVLEKKRKQILLNKEKAT